jgi:geranylgeranyl diphosphate synthase type II
MDESLAEVRRELEVESRAGVARSGELGAEHGRLWDAVGEAMDGGKRLRPQLLLAAHAGLGGTRGAAAARVAAALEVLHTALVIHDDVIDGDRVRRGRPNVSGRFAEDARAGGLPGPAAARYADAAGILAGDLALITAARMIATYPAEPATVERLLGLLDDAVHAAAAGELADVRCGLGLDGDPVLERTVEVAARKTASYSFELPLRAAAVLAEQPPATVAALGGIGRDLGVGFQLLDDLLGVFGDESRTGKSALGDLREGKATALIAHARSTPSWTVLESLVGDPRLDAHGAARARDALTDSGARDAVQDLADLHLDRALREARRAGLPAALVDSLRRIVEDIRRATAAALVPAPAAAGAAS